MLYGTLTQCHIQYYYYLHRYAGYCYHFYRQTTCVLQGLP